MQATDTQLQYTWKEDKFDNPKEYATAICVGNGLHRFAAIWNPFSGENGSGYLARWSPTSSKWLNLGGNFTNPINQMCADSNGNVYMVGDKGSQGDYVIKIFSATSSSWKEAGNKFTAPLTKICCDSNNTIYITGDFMNSNNQYYIEEYSLKNNTWTPLSGLSVPEPIQDICTDSKNSIYALYSTSTQSYISFWNGSEWQSIDLSKYGKADAMTCDNSGNIYFATTTTVIQYNISSKASTDLHALVPSFGSETYEFFLLHKDNLLYFAGYGYTSTVTTSGFVKVYSYSVWTDITPPEFAKTPFEAIFDIASYDGKSNNILVASNQNYLLDGVKLNK